MDIYEKHDKLCSIIFEEPNLLRNILYFLKPQDVVNLMISKGNFVCEHRFQDVTKHYLEKEKKNYIKRCEEEAYQERCKNVYIINLLYSYPYQKNV